jgi:hypothetical protein
LIIMFNVSSHGEQIFLHRNHWKDHPTFCLLMSSKL